MKVYIYNNGISNIKSVVNAIDFLGYEPILTENCEIEESCNHLILPGVGSFNAAMMQIKKNSSDLRIKDFKEKGGYILGICLGMQLLFNEGYEGSYQTGLGMLEGSVVALPPPNKKNNETLPNIGWSDVQIIRKNSLIKADLNIVQCYFVHSYQCIPADKNNIIMEINFGNKSVCAAVNNGRIYGVQFHPEKSGEIGLEILRNFCLQKDI